MLASRPFPRGNKNFCACVCTCVANKNQAPSRLQALQVLLSHAYLGMSVLQSGDYNGTLTIIITYHRRFSLGSRREWAPARTSVPNASAKSRAGREKNGEDSSKKKSFARASTPASYAGYRRLSGRRGGLLSWLVSSTTDQAVRFRALAGDIVLCFWARHLTLTALLSTQVYKWVPANIMLGVTLRWTSIPSRGE